MENPQTNKETLKNFDNNPFEKVQIKVDGGIMSAYQFRDKTPEEQALLQQRLIETAEETEIMELGVVDRLIEVIPQLLSSPGGDQTNHESLAECAANYLGDSSPDPMTYYPFIIKGLVCLLLRTNHFGSDNGCESESEVNPDQEFQFNAGAGAGEAAGDINALYAAIIPYLLRFLNDDDISHDDKVYNSDLCGDIIRHHGLDPNVTDSSFDEMMFIVIISCLLDMYIAKTT